MGQLERPSGGLSVLNQIRHQPCAMATAVAYFVKSSSLVGNTRKGRPFALMPFPESSTSRPRRGLFAVTATTSSSIE